MKRNIIFTTIILATLVFTGCRDKRENRIFFFEASVDQPVSNEKVDMINEQYIYFQKGDKISVASDKSETNSDNPLVGTLDVISSGGSGSYYHNGTFTTKLDEESKTFCAVYPQNDNIEIKYDERSEGFDAQCWFPRVQEYVNDETFGKLAYPMVAYAAKDSAYFEFHALCGIVRIQFFAPAEEGFSIDSIQVSSASKNLSGFFNIKDLTQHVPYVDSSTTGLTGSKTVSIKCSTPVSANSLCTFYLTLPAFSNQTQLYNDLSLVLHGKTNAGTKTEYSLNTKLSAYVGPRNITKMNAINVNDWIRYNDGGNGINPSGISGNGTANRPFEIYYASDLAKIRDAFNTTNGTLNGIKVQEGNYYYRIVRADIVLDNTNWTSGIKNFRGTMKYDAPTAPTAENGIEDGITNNSAFPLFESISQNGTLEKLTIKGTATLNQSIKKSPLCITNNGTIKDCHIAANYKCEYIDATTTPDSTNMGGICYTNNGTITGCGNSGTLHVGPSKNVASICYTNNGTIKECNLTNVKLSGKQIGGICFTNNKTIESCIFSAQMGSGLACDFGGIAFEQTTAGSITKCGIQGGSEIQTSGTFGGIVNKMNGGTLDYCGNTTIHGLGGQYCGGIVADMSNGTIKNCYCDMVGYTIYASGTGTNYCGGIAGTMKNGTITNSFSTANVSAVGTIDGYAGTIVGYLTGGTINNCYGWEYSENISGSGNNALYGFRQTGAGTITNCWSRETGASTTSGITFFDGTTSGNPSLLNVTDALNTNRGAGNTWILSTTEPRPILTASASKSRKLNRKK